MDDAARRRLRVLMGLAFGLIALALVWQFSPARAYLAPLPLIEAWQGVAQRLGWAAVLGSFVLACTLAVPLSLLTLLAVLAFDPWHGAALALLGASLCAVLTFALGRHLGQAAVTQWAGPRVQALNALAERRGLLAVIAVRLVPAAPFAVVNLVLGSTRIRWRALLLGNLLGMLPMVLVTAWAAPAILHQLQHPSAWGWAGLGGLLALLLGASLLVRRWVRAL
jgi:uncharacterized membrane protein YdjX (TVP38/TMEM64 family)